ncbi:hypothetical protein T439DRAFT_323284 [Meredithblackwellia eburnea MCA 4105]
MTNASPSAPAPTPDLIGSAPHLNRHLVLRTPHSYTSWPSHLDSVSSLYKELASWGRQKGLSDVGFAFSDSGLVDGEVVEWDTKRPRFEKPDSREVEELEAWLYPDFVKVPSPISVSNLTQLGSFYSSLPSLPSQAPPPTPQTSKPPPRRAHIYVCTHASRDCRCGDLGEPLYQALVKEARWRKIGGAMGEGDDNGDGVRIGRISHIGGHKYAGNALVYKEGGAGDWYGFLRDSDAGRLLDEALSPSEDPWWPRWRGRLGLKPEVTRSIYAERTANEPSLLKTSRKRDERPRKILGDPVPLVFKSWDGEDVFEVNGFEGESVMEVARRHDLPSILATCGGHCECATCHVHINPAFSTTTTSAIDSNIRTPTAVPNYPQLPPVSEEEEDQLEFALGRNENSRLSCQIPVSKELGSWISAGGTISLPRY